jgi:5-hydroxyisourate hydrolase
VINFYDSKVLDSSTGKPAQGVAIHLEYLESDVFLPLVKGYICYALEIPINLNYSRITNSDGRCLDLLPSRGSEEATRKKSNPVAGQIYKIIFKTKEYFENTERKSFYPWVEVSTMHRVEKLFSGSL